MAIDAKLIVRLTADNAQLSRKLNQSKKQLRTFQSSTAKISKVIQTNFAAMLGGAAIAQGARFAIGTLVDFEFQMDKVAAVSGATAKEVQMLTKNAKELGARSKFTATEIGQLQEQLARLGFGTRQIVKMTDAARQLSTVADADLGQSASSLGKVLNAFQIDASKSTEVANIMAESFSKSALDIEKFDVAMGNVAAVAASVGMPLAETTAILGKLVDNGIEASKAGTDLRRILLNLSSSGMTMDDAFKQILGSTNQVTTAQTLFGDRAAASALILAKQSDAVNKLTGELSDATKEMTRMSAIMEDNLKTDFAIFQSAIQGLILNEGGGLNDFLRTATQGFTNLVTAMSLDEWTPQAWNALQEEIYLASQGYADLIEKQRTSLSLMGNVGGGGIPSAPSVKQFGGGPRGPRSNTSGASSLASDGAIGEFFDASAITDNSADIIAAYGVLSGGFDISADELDAATAKMEKSLEFIGSMGPNLSEQAAMIYEPIQKFGSDLSFGAQIIATGFTSLADSFFQGGQDIGQAITETFAKIMRQIGLKFIEAGALFFANSLLAQAATGGIPNPLSIQNAKQGAAAIGIGVALGASGGALGRLSKGAGGGSGAGGASFGGSSQNINLTGQFRVRGADLVTVLKREESVVGRTG
jgi:hypothetical protein